ncbi:glycohydrolase toxin TNT-related protein [Paenimyroides tangerinum]|uniref:glycohydrolase toxin TNT-related protein n=1 Tax=Paenimyroides tangerinum TaxID=2488728 RepID=UPI001315701D|nr:glycohydrolase toxin TNT-related protein [Paenimyroides tangerinum]
MFKSINIKWLPAFGGYNIVDNVPLTKGMKFDRYCSSIGYSEKGNLNLNGNFTSPIENGTPFSFSQRALVKLRNEYDVYYEIEVLKDLPFTAQNADVIPWFGQLGKGKQSMWNIPKNPNSPKDYSYTLTELAEMGYIKITIKESPNGKFKSLVNKEIP